MSSNDNLKKPKAAAVVDDDDLDDFDGQVVSSPEV